VLYSPRVMDTQMDTKVGGPVLGDVETQRMTSPTNRERFTFTLGIGQCCHPGQPGRRGVRPGDRVGETRGPSDRVKRPRLESRSAVKRHEEPRPAQRPTTALGRPQRRRLSQGEITMRCELVASHLDDHECETHERTDEENTSNLP
jgi:hypothetical protein